MSKSDHAFSPALRRASLLNIARTIAWSFFGVRRKARHDIATENITLPQIIVAGVIGAGLLVACFLTVAIVATSGTFQ
jgi:hypothetical protein